ncbi:MAG TPA: hypothetical protein VF529_19965 [Solirubrobacteraceae bacterium]
MLIWAITLSAAGAVAAVPGAAAATRDAFRFQLHTSSPAGWNEAATYFVTNSRIVVALLLGAWAHSRSGRMQPVLRAIAVTTVAINAVVVGAALGAYGGAAVRRLVHLPLEWMALAVSLAAYAGRDRRHELRPVLYPGLVAGCLLACAAVLEAFAPR